MINYKERLSRFLQNFLYGDVSYKKILGIAWPLILSMSSFTVMQFVDRKFLVLYSPDAFEASAPAGMTSFMFMAFFFGIASYTNSFVAQYFGAKNNKMVGKSLWHGLYFALIAWIILIPVSQFGTAIFEMIGHDSSIIGLESTYFRILMYGAGPVLVNLVLSCFFNGRGKVKTVMWVRCISMLINIPLDYCMIFGKFGIPEMGIAGAAWASVLATCFTTAAFTFLVFRKNNVDKYGLLTGFKFELKLFKRLLKFGIPNGVQFVLEILGITFFLLMIGRLGKVELAASSAAWSLNSLVFMPMVGFSITISTLVGQSIGRKNVELAKVATMNCFVMVAMYMTTMASMYLFFPIPFLNLLLKGGDPIVISKIMEMAVVFLKFVAFYSSFSAMSMIFSSAIKGAGDTKYVMNVSFVLSVVFLIVPSYLFSTVWVCPATVLWSFGTLYVVFAAIFYFRRYRSGQWQKMSVIDL